MICWFGLAEAQPRIVCIPQDKPWTLRSPVFDFPKYGELQQNSKEGELAIIDGADSSISIQAPSDTGSLFLE
jgi:hypothetical protein